MIVLISLLQLFHFHPNYRYLASELLNKYYLFVSGVNKKKKMGCVVTYLNIG